MCGMGYLWVVCKELVYSVCVYIYMVFMCAICIVCMLYIVFVVWCGMYGNVYRCCALWDECVIVAFLIFIALILGCGKVKYAGTLEHVWRPEDNLQESVLSFYQVGPGDWSQAWQQVPLPPEPSHWPKCLIVYHCCFLGDAGSQLAVGTPTSSALQWLPSLHLEDEELTLPRQCMQVIPPAWSSPQPALMVLLMSSCCANDKNYISSQLGDPVPE